MSAIKTVARTSMISGLSFLLLMVYAGTGFAAPIEISNVTDLQNMQNNLAGSYILKNNIDASDTSGWNELIDKGAWDEATAYAKNDWVTHTNAVNYYCVQANTGTEPGTSEAHWIATTLAAGVFLGFEPVGNPTTTFSGVLNGQGYAISNLYVNRSDGTGTVPPFQMGLFGTTSSASTIKHVSLKDVNITGPRYVGGLAGISYGVITNSHVTGSVTGGAMTGGLVGRQYAGSTMIRCSFSGDVVGAGNTGGLVGGWGANNVVESFATGTVTSSSGAVAGLVGRYGGTVLNSYARAAVDSGGNIQTGGLTGRTVSDVVNSFSTGTSSGFALTGGGGTYDVIDCFWDVETSGITEDANGGTPKTTAEMKDIQTYLDAGWDIEINETHDLNDGYPYLSWQLHGADAPASPVWLIHGIKIKKGTVIILR